MIVLDRMFQSGMVLQRDKMWNIWGKGTPGEEISILIQGQKKSVKVNESGDWHAKMQPLSVSTEEVLQVSKESDVIILEDIVVGEVWIAAGQSNMEFFMRYEKHLEEVKKICKNNLVRFYDTPKCAYVGQDKDFDYSPVGKWRKADENNIEYFSAVGYYFEQYLENELNIPVGIIGCNWGGTYSAAWMNPATIMEAAPEWMDDLNDQMKHIEWDTYFSNQKLNPMNNTGHPFENIFNEFVLPKTRSLEDLGAFFASLGAAPPAVDGDIWVQNIPGSLYENMVKRIAPFTVKGVLWYQGESDDGEHAECYASMLSGLIHDWRTLWDDDLPFLIVQLPGWESWLDSVNQKYNVIRAAQESVCRSLNQTWLCSISDVGEQYDIHPKNKKTVGERLALLALGHLYGKDILCDPPVLKSAARNNEQIILTFSNAESGLMVKGKLEDLHIYSGAAEIPFEFEVADNKIIITMETNLETDVVISYANEKYYKVDLYNKAMIPAIPFIKTIV